MFLGSLLTFSVLTDFQQIKFLDLSKKLFIEFLFENHFSSYVVTFYNYFYFYFYLVYVFCVIRLLVYIFLLFCHKNIRFVRIIDDFMACSETCDHKRYTSPRFKNQLGHDTSVNILMSLMNKLQHIIPTIP